MRLHQYLITEDRSTNIHLMDCVERLKQHCSQSIKSFKKGNVKLYRGMKYGSSECYYINPVGDRPRRSANTDNYYTLLMDNSPKWKGYPKRSQSIICTNDPGYAMTYGQVYHVFPYDNTTLGVAPFKDFWGSFFDSIKHDLDFFNYELSKRVFGDDIFISDTNYKGIIKSFKDFDLFVNSNKDKLIEVQKYVPWMKDYKGDLLKLITSIFDPKKNGFKVQNISKPIDKASHEIWTDSNSIMIKYSRTNDIINPVLSEVV